MTYFTHNAIVEGRKRIRAAFGVATQCHDCRDFPALFMSRNDIKVRRAEGRWIELLAKIHEGVRS